ncbi:Na(+)/H(+) antiporter subunit B [Lacicoccus alkaliphilus]|uniref:Multisubunit sodium/proton antiporter, MrpB subunit (TC 2.A.63.1) n=1 Tax=Lacicoccus alkaliphilus DSM 16010 TaxID=1123231 RepID=A0A1M7FK16_9BACL|nr:Na(+)/H(+) antiporter subunit B [Salinicoccus alkaliphilus]SHM04411.1 multisubunit sodium/proton antiporter, MrpB subunit (TC 2.A.63.1) [Salinicoccus alkaliphilus DSM 16010]
MKSTLKKLGYNRVHKQMNDVFLKYTAKVVFLVIITFSINLFFSGHYTPGGGFVGGLLAAGAIILLLLAYDLKTLNRMIRIDNKRMITAGLAACLIVPILLMFFGNPFFTHQHMYLQLPVFGEVPLHTAVLFDVGVYIIVAATTLLIITLLASEQFMSDSEGADRE